MPPPPNGAYSPPIKRRAVYKKAGAFGPTDAHNTQLAGVGRGVGPAAPLNSPHASLTRARRTAALTIFAREDGRSGVATTSRPDAVQSVACW